MAGVEMQGVGVTVTQPGAAAPSGVWHDDLFSCMADPGFCMYTCCCPACAVFSCLVPCDSHFSRFVLLVSFVLLVRLPSRPFVCVPSARDFLF